MKYAIYNNDSKTAYILDKDNGKKIPIEFRENAADIYEIEKLLDELYSRKDELQERFIDISLEDLKMSNALAFMIPTLIIAICMFLYTTGVPIPSSLISTISVVGYSFTALKFRKSHYMKKKKSELKDMMNKLDDEIMIQESTLTTKKTLNSKKECKEGTITELKALKNNSSKLNELDPTINKYLSQDYVHDWTVLRKLTEYVEKIENEYEGEGFIDYKDDCDDYDNVDTIGYQKKLSLFKRNNKNSK